MDDRAHPAGAGMGGGGAEGLGREALAVRGAMVEQIELDDPRARRLHPLDRGARLGAVPASWKARPGSVPMFTPRACAIRASIS